MSLLSQLSTALSVVALFALSACGTTTQKTYVATVSTPTTTYYTVTTTTYKTAYPRPNCAFEFYYYQHHCRGGWHGLGSSHCYLKANDC